MLFMVKVYLKFQINIAILVPFINKINKGLDNNMIKSVKLDSLDNSKIIKDMAMGN
jgi:hypothetical protein